MGTQKSVLPHLGFLSLFGLHSIDNTNGDERTRNLLTDATDDKNGDDNETTLSAFTQLCDTWLI